MTSKRDQFIKVTNYLKNAALILLVAFITVKCDVLNELTREPLPKAGTTNRPSPERPDDSKPLKGKELALRKDIVSYAKQYEGIKYHAGGKTPRTGFDCSGFTSHVMDYFDIDISASSQAQSKQGRVKSLDEVQPGDLIFFRRSAREPIFHVAMVVSKDRKSLRVIHSTSSRGVVIDDILASEYWRTKIDVARDVVSSTF
ncbi:MAG: C40 family peptidase [Saprospiraceae bacterium]